MKAIALLIGIIGMILSQSVAAQTADAAVKPVSQPTAQNSKPAKDATIVKFFVEGEDKSAKADSVSGPGPLHIIYSDETEMLIPRERAVLTMVKRF